MFQTYQMLDTLTFGHYNFMTFKHYQIIIFALFDINGIVSNIWGQYFLQHSARVSHGYLQARHPTSVSEASDEARDGVCISVEYLQQISPGQIAEPDGW